MTLNAKPESVATLLVGGFACVTPFLERLGVLLSTQYQIVFPDGYLDTKLGPFLMGVAMYMLVKRAVPVVDPPPREDAAPDPLAHIQ